MLGASQAYAAVDAKLVQFCITKKGKLSYESKKWTCTLTNGTKVTVDITDPKAFSVE